MKIRECIESWSVGIAAGLFAVLLGVAGSLIGLAWKLIGGWG